MRKHGLLSLLLAAMVIAGTLLPAAALSDGISWSTGPQAPNTIDAVYLSDRYPTVSGNMRVCHNAWVKGGWDKSEEKLRTEGNMFYMNGTTYRKGIAMYLTKGAFGSSIVGATASASVQYTLNGAYRSLTFDLGADQSDSRYCGYDDGQASVEIFADNKCVFSTNWFSGGDFERGITVNVAGASKLTIVLHISKGSNNTLGVVLGNPTLS